MIVRLFRTLLFGGIPAALGVCLLAGGIAAWREFGLRRRRRQLDSLIRATADRHRLDPCLVRAVIHQESRFQCDARGDAGEIGLMQITPGAARDWERLNRRKLPHDSLLFAPAVNLEIGVWYLARASRQFRHHPDRDVLALSQYNAGRRRALRWEAEYEENLLDHIPIASTRHYITNVFELRADYAQTTSPQVR